MGLMKQRLVVIMGPTGAGKTEVSLHLAEMFNGEIISADAFQVYRGLDIGTAKAKPAEQKRVVHHLLDIKEVTDNYTVAEFCERARVLITDIAARGKTPFLVGGTGLYVQALLEGYIFSDIGPVREWTQRYNEMYRTQGLERLREEMRQRSPEYFATRTVGDPQRLIRALSVLAAGGSYEATKQSDEPLYTGPIFALVPPREILYERINARVEKMFAEGLENEARWLWQKHEGSISQAGKGIGYREWPAYFAGAQTREETLALIQLHTRRFAKRQMTWLRRMPYITYIDPCVYPSAQALADAMQQIIKNNWET